MQKKRPSESAFLQPRALFGAFLCVAGMLLAVFGLAGTPTRNSDQTRNAAASKIAPWVLERTANGQEAEFLVVMADQADLSAAKALPTREAKGRFVRDALWNKAQSGQASVLQWLRERKIEHRSYYIVNLVWVKSTIEVAEALAARPDVLRVEGNPQIQNLVDPFLQEEAPVQPESITAIETGITYTHAPQVWALGYTGQGVVVAGADTGYRWTHNVLKNKYRGWDGANASHDYNWHDSIHSGGGVCGANSTQPCDDNGHGSHTMGTVVGDDGGANQVGMAPGAKWIGCRNMDQGNGTPATYIECMEFFLAPYPVSGTPAQGDPTKAPNLTTNSWGCPTSEGCSAGSLQAAVEAQRAAGIMMVVAAGNAGSSCSTVNDPPAIYDASYSVGALTNGTDTIASFSSRGPVTLDGSNRPKPDICAPGTSVRSANRTSDSAYMTIQGTSMAAPHVAGAVALLWSAQPSLRGDIPMTETILNETAAHVASSSCSSSGTPNNTYGFGRIDIKAAVDRALLRTIDVTNNGTDVTVNFFAVAGRTYRLERKIDLDLVNPPWQSIAGVSDITPGATGPAQFVDPGQGNQAHVFYHVRLMP